MARLRPQWLAVLGVTVYRTAFGHPGAVVGPQAAAIGPTRLWVLPNPSGLNAHWTPAALAGEFARLRAQASGPLRRCPAGPDRPPRSRPSPACATCPRTLALIGQITRRSARPREMSQEGRGQWRIESG